jgi:hypothetical protein
VERFVEHIRPDSGGNYAEVRFALSFDRRTIDQRGSRKTGSGSADPDGRQAGDVFAGRCTTEWAASTDRLAYRE